MIVLHFVYKGEDIIRQMCLYFNMEEEDILNHTMPSVICLHFSQIVYHFVTYTYTS